MPPSPAPTQPAPARPPVQPAKPPVQEEESPFLAWLRGQQQPGQEENFFFKMIRQIIEAFTGAKPSAGPAAPAGPAASAAPAPAKPAQPAPAMDRAPQPRQAPPVAAAPAPRPRDSKPPAAGPRVTVITPDTVKTTPPGKPGPTPPLPRTDDPLYADPYAGDKRLPIDDVRTTQFVETGEKITIDGKTYQIAMAVTPDRVDWTGSGVSLGNNESMKTGRFVLMDEKGQKFGIGDYDPDISAAGNSARTKLSDDLMKLLVASSAAREPSLIRNASTGDKPVIILDKSVSQKLNQLARASEAEAKRNAELNAEARVTLKPVLDNNGKAIVEEVEWVDPRRFEEEVRKETERNTPPATSDLIERAMAAREEHMKLHPLLDSNGKPYDLSPELEEKSKQSWIAAQQKKEAKPVDEKAIKDRLRATEKKQVTTMSADAATFKDKDGTEYAVRITGKAGLQDTSYRTAAGEIPHTTYGWEPQSVQLVKITRGSDGKITGEQPVPDRYVPASVKGAMDDMLAYAKRSSGDGFFAINKGSPAVQFSGRSYSDAVATLRDQATPGTPVDWSSFKRDELIPRDDFKKMMVEKFGKETADKLIANMNLDKTQQYTKIQIRHNEADGKDYAVIVELPPQNYVVGAVQLPEDAKRKPPQSIVPGNWDDNISLRKLDKAGQDKAMDEVIAKANGTFVREADKPKKFDVVHVETHGAPKAVGGTGGKAAEAHL